MRQYFHRSDANAKEIYGYLTQLGITYQPVGVVDIICGYGGLCMAAEIRQKGHLRVPRKGRQEKFHAKWTGCIYWLQCWEDCVAIKYTFVQWHKAIQHRTVGAKKHPLAEPITEESDD